MKNQITTRKKKTRRGYERKYYRKTKFGEIIQSLDAYM